MKPSALLRGIACALFAPSLPTCSDAPATNPSTLWLSFANSENDLVLSASTDPPAF